MIQRCSAISQSEILLTVAASIFFVLFPIVAQTTEIAPGSPQDNGAKLFTEYGCNHCHGLDGATPAAKYVPVIKGKTQDQIKAGIESIFGGNNANRMAALMHDNYCQDEADGGTSCSSGPTDSELEEIASWLTGTAALPKKKRTPQGLYLNSHQAYSLMRESGKSILFVDIRTRAEVVYIGSPDLVDANIPFGRAGEFSKWDDKKKKFKLIANGDFINQIRTALKKKGLDKESRIILMCRSGKRSANAARVLHIAGFEYVYSVTDGFEGDTVTRGQYKGERLVNGWKNNELPWSYRVDKGKLY